MRKKAPYQLDGKPGYKNKIWDCPKCGWRVLGPFGHGPPCGLHPDEDVLEMMPKKKKKKVGGEEQ